MNANCNMIEFVPPADYLIADDILRMRPEGNHNQHTIMHNRTGTNLDGTPHGCLVRAVVLEDGVQGNQDDGYLGTLVLGKPPDREDSALFDTSLQALLSAPRVVEALRCDPKAVLNFVHCVGHSYECEIVAKGVRPLLKVFDGPGFPRFSKKAGCLKGRLVDVVFVLGLEMRPWLVVKPIKLYGALVTIDIIE